MTDSAAPASNVIQFEDFAKLDLRVARILEVLEHPNADKLYVLKIDCGGGEQRQLCAGIRSHYTPDQLVGRLIVIVANLAPRSLRGEVSQGMLLAASSTDKSQVIVLTPEAPIEPGSKVS